MFITFTSGKGTPEQLQAVTAFLRTFLPRLEQQPGVVSVYHYTRPEQGDDTTIIVWASREALQAYRDSDLMREVATFEQANGMAATREGYPLDYPA